jgi:uncharacterized protein (TIGR00725 family)
MSLPGNPKAAIELSGLSAPLRALAERQRGARRLRQPVAIIGPREASAEQVQAAYEVAHALACCGVILVCGGKVGVMEGAARGAQAGGGICIGLLPEEEARHGNPYLTVALPTGMGLSRNALVVRSSLCAIAIGGGLGTMSEMALALQWQLPVFAALGSPRVPGAQHFESGALALDAAARWLAVVEDRDVRDLGG